MEGLYGRPLDPKAGSIPNRQFCIPFTPPATAHGADARALFTTTKWTVVLARIFHSPSGFFAPRRICGDKSGWAARFFPSRR